MPRRQREETLSGRLRESDPETAADPLGRIMADEHLG